MQHHGSTTNDGPGADANARQQARTQTYQYPLLQCHFTSGVTSWSYMCKIPYLIVVIYRTSGI
jgi:hypothetical protein